MTVCVAAISRNNDDSGDVLIVSADRLITHAGTRAYQLRDQTKTFWFPARAPCSEIVVLLSGDINLMLEVCRDAAVKFKLSSRPSVREFAEILASTYAEYRISPTLALHGLTHETFLSEQKNLSRDVVRSIIGDMRSGKLDLESDLIVAGHDGGGAEIFIVTEPGVVQSRTATGFAAVGMGGEHAESVFTEADFTGYRTWTESLLLVYLAKFRAETSRDVGDATDIYYFTKKDKWEIQPASPCMTAFRKIAEAQKKQQDRAFLRDHEKVLKLIEKAQFT